MSSLASTLITLQIRFKEVKDTHDYHDFNERMFPTKKSQNGLAKLLFIFIQISLLLSKHKVYASIELSQKTNKNILTIGSLNADTFLTVNRLPKCGENLTTLPSHPPLLDIPGGKGCNQAIAVSKFSTSLDENNESKTKSIFWGQFGNDVVGDLLKDTLQKYNVDCSPSRKSTKYTSGRGYVFVEKSTGLVSAVVSGGSNMNGWEDIDPNNDVDVNWLSPSNISKILDTKQCGYMLLQREIPESVNLHMVRAAKESHRRIVVLQDVGGEDRPIDIELLKLCDYIMPNETELRRLVHSLSKQSSNVNESLSSLAEVNVLNLNDNSDIETKIKTEILPLAQSLQTYYGANNVLVTLGEDGSLFLPKRSNDVSVSAIYQPPCKLPSSVSAVDETGAGDCFRAAFVVALSELDCNNDVIDCNINNDSRMNTNDANDIQKCLEFASAAGALAVTVPGAVPSIPSREDVIQLCQSSFESKKVNDIENNALNGNNIEINKVRGGSNDNNNNNNNNNDEIIREDECPLLFGSRLNSMKDQPHLSPTHPQTVQGWVSRQSTIRGLDLVDFNYPQHFVDWTVAEAKQALDEANLKAGSVCLRYPHTKFQLGAMTHPDPKIRQEAIEVTKGAAAAALELGCDEVVVWSAYDGYDYPFQVNHDEKWEQIVDAFRECCDAYPNIKFSLEYKPTDENTRFFTVPSTGAAVLLVNEINRDNMGLTLDVGHMLMSGENPAQSIALAGKKLFGVQLNDGYTRLAAEDGLMFGSVHPTMALECIYYLQKIGFQGHLYFDTFPQRTDPVKECEYNIQRVKEFWRAAKYMRDMGVEKTGGIMSSHDALGALNLMDKAFSFARSQRNEINEIE